MYDDWSVVAFETPTAAKWNILGDNDAFFNSIIGAAGGGALLEVRIYTAGATWTKPTGLRFVEVEVLGGGGGGGGAGATTSGQYSCGSGGGAGVWAYKKILAAALGATETVTIGAAGAANAGAAGGAGGNSSFGAHCTANGGSGGNIETAANSAGRFTPAPDPVSTGTGDLVCAGEAGYNGEFDPNNNNVALGGHGGNSRYGSGGRNSEANSAGQAAAGRGSGGGGAALTTSQSAIAGGVGTAGLVIVREYL